MNTVKKYTAAEERYETMQYRRCGVSGIKLPMISLGLWHNFGDTADLTNGRLLLRTAFDKGITHFDLANNYGPPYGAAETNFGRLYREDFKSYRDELIISSKAGYDMWPGPYGNWGSRKYLISSCDQSLKRMGLDYLDIFYHHRPDPETPLEETMSALDQLVRSGKALYVGVSNYDAERTRKAAALLKQMGTPFLVHQPRYNMFDRWVEDGLLDALEDTGLGSVVFSPLQQGLLTDKYLNGIPKDSRAANSVYLSEDRITPEILYKVEKLDSIARDRGQSLAQMAISWLLKDTRVTSVLIGVSKVEQLHNNLNALHNLAFSEGELKHIEEILGS
ncbi:MAG: L-glyceraldehyde 3-phosphate reductase [Leeuwenhoekiella sp.]|nr:MAG: L-glyceraldehyde 3-phosphate reductase [Leeuwenhoekiella sp.]